MGTRIKEKAILKKNKLVSKGLQIIVVLLGITFISYFLMYLSPGDPVKSLFYASGIEPTEAQLEQTRVSLGLDKPFHVQYFRWLFHCLRGDLGMSISTGEPVAQLLLSRLIPTLNLTLLSMVFMLIMALPMGIASAVYANKPIDNIIRIFNFFTISMPNFWVGMLLLYFIALQWGLLPVIAVRGGFEAMILPALTLGIAMAGKYSRQVRSIVLEQLFSDYVIGARARGIPPYKIMLSYVLPNSMLPLVTLLGLSIGSLLGGTAVVEVIFSYSALGSLAMDGITSMDYPLVQGYVLFCALVYMLINLLVDYIYYLIDPHVRKGEA